MEAQAKLKRELKLTDKEHGALANYGLCDTYDSGSVSKWQQQTKQEMLHFDQMEQELGESIFEGSDKRIIINILNR